MMNELLRKELGEARNIQFDIWTGVIEEGEAKERFKINDLDGANWAFRKLKAILEKENEIKGIMQKEIERIQNWAKDELDKLENSTQFFEGLLTEYFIAEKEKDPKFKISTPYGKVSSRKQQPKWNYEDEKLIGYLENYKPELIRIKKEVNKNDFKKAVKEKDGFILMDDGKVVSNETGELIEGVTVEERPDSINIKVAE